MKGLDIRKIYDSLKALQDGFIGNQRRHNCKFPNCALPAPVFRAQLAEAERQVQELRDQLASMSAT